MAAVTLGPIRGSFSVVMRIFDSPRTPRSPVVRQLIKYGLVGVTNTLAFYVVYAICVHFGMWYLAASALGFAVGAANSYLLNRNWTFRANARHSTTVARYVVVQVAGLLGNLGIVFLMVDGLGLHKLVGQPIAIVFVVLGMFLANRYWTFADALSRERAARGAEWSVLPQQASASAEQSELIQRVAAASPPRTR
ncbi:MAG TPA: GtrA family protein [Solirubrobacteraceae bacterium]|jgi:putative flippase GtrA|nr:GtrA family protein [Solirubrobacteraceae bacterium]